MLYHCGDNKLLKWAIGGALLAVLIAGFFLLARNSKPQPVLGGGESAMPATVQSQLASNLPSSTTVQAPLFKRNTILQAQSQPGGPLESDQGERMELEATEKSKAEEKRLAAERNAKAAEERRQVEEAAREKQRRNEYGALVADIDAALKSFKKSRAIAKAKVALQLYPGDAKVKELLAKAEFLQFPSHYTDPATGMEFMLVEGGCYPMGSNTGDSDEKPVHEVCVDSFYLGKYEVTQAQYQKIVGSNPSNFRGNELPVVNVSWHDAQSFAGKLNGSSNKGSRLPTEAEWEYAARSGSKDEKHAGTNSGTVWCEYDWYDMTSSNQTHPVGQKKPNGLGLHDMNGNVWEWCSDLYGDNYYTFSPRNNPQGPGSGTARVFRGSCINTSSLTRAASRYRSLPSLRNINLGFRVAFPARF